MFPALTALLHVNPDELSEKGSFILLEDSRTDGSFLLHHFVSMFLKGGGGVCLLSLSHTFLHYNSIGQKLGTNLATAKENHQLTFLECLPLLQKSICDQISSGEINTTKNPFQDFESPDFSLKCLYQLLKEKLQEMPFKSKLLLIDDLSMLLTIGISPTKVVDFMHYCYALTNTADLKNICFVGLVHSDVNDMEMMYLKNQACYYADLEIFARGLETGYSRDIHGEIKIRRRDKESEHDKYTSEKTMQYKLTDNGVNFFAPGTSVAVL